MYKKRVSAGWAVKVVALANRQIYQTRFTKGKTLLQQINNLPKTHFLVYMYESSMLILHIAWAPVGSQTAVWLSTTLKRLASPWHWSNRTRRRMWRNAATAAHLLTLSARNEVDALEVMKKHRTHLIALQMLRVHTPSLLTDLTLIELVKATQTWAVCLCRFHLSGPFRGADGSWQITHRHTESHHF